MRYLLTRKKKSAPIPKKCVKSNKFCLKILIAMNELQCNCRFLFGEGMIESDITKFIQERFKADGDVKSQVRICLRQLLLKGLISRQEGRYRLVGPMVRVIQRPPESLCRYMEIDRVSKIFWPTGKKTSAIVTSFRRICKSIRRFLKY